MRRFTILVVVGALLALSLAMVSQSGAKRGHKVSASLGVGSGHGLTSLQLEKAGWECFDVPGLGIHCAPPGVAWPPIPPNPEPPVVQLLYFNNVDNVGTQFRGTETLMRKDIYAHGTPPCPFQGGSWTDLTSLGLSNYLGCHRR